MWNRSTHGRCLQLEPEGMTTRHHLFIKSKKSYYGKGTTLGDKDKVWYNTLSMIYKENNSYRRTSVTMWGFTCQVIVKFGHMFNIGDCWEKFFFFFEQNWTWYGPFRKSRRENGKREERTLPESSWHLQVWIPHKEL